MKNQSKANCNNGNSRKADSNAKKSSTRDLMNRLEEKQKKNDNHIPNTQSMALVPGSNWEKFKSLVTESTVTEKNNKHQPQNTRPYKRCKWNSKKMVQLTMNITDTLHTSNNNTKENQIVEVLETKITKQIAIDCEMVGIGDGTDSMIARVSIVNRFGICLYDKYVKPREEVCDYRTAVSGIRPHHLYNGEEFKTVQQEVAEILKGRILVGHALKNDLAVLYLSHPKRSLRDTSKYKPFRKVTMGNTPSLKKLACELLGVDIQTGEHNSVEDARTAMQLYMLYKNRWEMEIHSKR